MRRKVEGRERGIGRENKGKGRRYDVRKKTEKDEKKGGRRREER